MTLPIHKYYSLKKAAKLAGCDVSDLIHFASIGVLQICIKIPMIDFFFNIPESADEEVNVIQVTSTSTLSFEGRIFTDESSETFEELVTDENADHEQVFVLEDELPEFSRHFLRYSYKSEYFSITERYEVNYKRKEIEKWSGFLAIPQEFIEAEERFLSDNWDDWDITVDTLFPPRCENFVNGRGYTIGYFYMDDWYNVNSKDMYITHYELELLRSGGRHVNDDPNTNHLKQSVSSQGVIQSVNKRVERHAANREGLLKASIFILSKYPNECRGERKEISPEKWRDCLLKHKDEVPPLMITSAEVILKHLRTAVNGKLDS